MRQQGHSNRQWGQDGGIIAKTRHVHSPSQVLKGADDWGPVKVSWGGEVHPRDQQHGDAQGGKAADGCHLDAPYGTLNVGGLHQGGAGRSPDHCTAMCLCHSPSPLPNQCQGPGCRSDGISVPITLVILTVNIRNVISNTMSIISLRCGPINHFKLSCGWAWGICGDSLHSIVGRNGGDIPILGDPVDNSDRVPLTLSLSFPLTFSLPLPFAEGLAFT